MREIKFRAWNETERKMTTPFAWVNESNLFSTCMCSAPTHELMQFTGMCDKFGMEIYDGDIIEFNEQTMVVRIIIDCWMAQDVSDKSIIEYGAEWESSCIVIGNIHQHAHLLEQNK